MTSLPVASPASALTRSEAAYAHLASFQRGDVVIVSGRGFSQPGTVTTAQQDAGSDIRRAFLTVTGCGVETRVSVATLLSGRFTVATQADAAAGRTRYFDEHGYAAQNGTFATLRADLKAAGWSARSADAGTMLSGEDRAEMIRDYGIEG